MNIRLLGLLVVLALLVPACGGGGGGGGGAPPAPGVDLPFTRPQQANDDVYVLALAADGSGDLYVGGRFTTYNGQYGPSLVRLNSDGTVDAAFSIGAGFDGDVYALAAATDGSGDVYVGGWFSTFDGNASSGIARLNDDGSLDSGFVVGTGFNSTVNVLAIAADGSGDVYAVGAFTEYDGAGGAGIARLNADGSLDGGFAVGTGFDDIAYGLIVMADGSGDVYASGYFTTCDGAPVENVVRFDSDGSIDAAFVTGTGFNDVVNSIAATVDGSGDLYAAGYFTDYDGTPVGQLVRLNDDGTLDGGFDTGTGLYGQGYAMVVATDGSNDLILAGSAYQYNEAEAGNIVRINDDGTQDSAFVNVPGTIGSVRTLALADDGSGDVFVGGEFRVAAGEGANHVARLDTGGVAVGTFLRGTGFDFYVSALAAATDGSGDVYAGGNFSFHDGVNIERLIRLNADGTRDGGFDIGSKVIGDVMALAAATDGSGDVYVGGYFTQFDGDPSAGIVRVNPDGTRDAGFAVGSGFDNLVRALAPARDGSGDIYAAGDFTTYDGLPAGRIIRLNSDGSRDAAFAAGTGFVGIVYTIAAATDGSGDLYAGGFFNSYNGSPAPYLLRLNADGTPDAGFAVGTGFDNGVTTMRPALDGSGDLYVGGVFAQYNGAGGYGIIRLNSNGTRDSAFAVGTGFDSSVMALALAPDGSGDIYAGGYFGTYNGATTSWITRLNPNGTVDPGFSTGNGFNAGVRALAAATDGFGDLYVGGEFTSYDTTTADRLVALDSDGSVD